MPSNTPDYPGGYPNYVPQSDQGYGTPPSPSYGARRPEPYDVRQPSSNEATQRSLSEPAQGRYYGDTRGRGSAPAPTSRRGGWIGLIVAVFVVLLLAGGVGLYLVYQSGETTKPV